MWDTCTNLVNKAIQIYYLAVLESRVPDQGAGRAVVSEISENLFPCLQLLSHRISSAFVSPSFHYQRPTFAYLPFLCLSLFFHYLISSWLRPLLSLIRPPIGALSLWITHYLWILTERRPAAEERGLIKEKTLWGNKHKIKSTSSGRP